MRNLRARPIVEVVAFIVGISVRPVTAVFLPEAVTPAGMRQELEARNRAFLNAMEVFDVDSVLTFFPRDRDFTYTFTYHHPAGDSVSSWRFPAVDARRAIEGPLRLSLDQQGHVLGVGTFASALAFTDPNWKRVRGSRFVPPAAVETSAVYVQWTREGSQWVVVAFGDEGYADPSMEPLWVP